MATSSPVLNDVLACVLTITHVDESREDGIPALLAINTSKPAMPGA
jgi:hypothetical protein